VATEYSHQVREKEVREKRRVCSTHDFTLGAPFLPSAAPGK